MEEGEGPGVSAPGPEGEDGQDGPEIEMDLAGPRGSREEEWRRSGGGVEEDRIVSHENEFRFLHEDQSSLVDTGINSCLPWCGCYREDVCIS